MNRAEAKTILLLYRSEADAADPQIAEALALAKDDPELTRWFQDYCAAQQIMREKFRQVAVPPALKEQIIAERAVMLEKRRRKKKVLLAALAALIIAAIGLGLFAWPHGRKGRPSDSIIVYRAWMIDFATRGYAMDLSTNHLEPIHAFFAQRQAPADYRLPAPLAQAPATGCTVRDWNGLKVSMICFRTGKPLAANQAGDLWLFVIDRHALKDVPAATAPQFTDLNGIATATWVQGDKLYVLGTPGDEAAVRKYL